MISEHLEDMLWAEIESMSPEEVASLSSSIDDLLRYIEAEKIDSEYEESA